jgi:hypothetical protein
MDIELLDSEQSLRILRSLAKKDVPAFTSPQFKGHISAVCREEKTGEEVWRVDQDNIITDAFKFLWYGLSTNNNVPPYCQQGVIIVSSFSETPDARRCFITGPTDTANIASNTGITPTFIGSEHARLWSTVFTTPASPRTVACIGFVANNYTFSARWGAPYCAYSLITPSKTQGTTQTLEVSYKIYLTGIG